MILIIFLGVSAILYLVPVKLIENNNYFMVVSMHYHGLNVTNSVNTNDLIQILGKYQKRRTLKNIPNTEPEIELNLVNKQQPLHIIIGKESLCYKEKDGEVWVILKGDQLKKELLLLLNCNINI